MNLYGCLAHGIPLALLNPNEKAGHLIGHHNILQCGSELYKLNSDYIRKFKLYVVKFKLIKILANNNIKSGNSTEN